MVYVPALLSMAISFLNQIYVGLVPVSVALDVYVTGVPKHIGLAGVAAISIAGCVTISVF